MTVREMLANTLYFGSLITSLAVWSWLLIDIYCA